MFLDDIDDVPIAMQVKLLRVPQNRTVERVGEIPSIAVDVRVMAATKKDLRDMVATKAFRENLYYRLNVLPLALPLLRGRAEDVPTLMEHFLTRFFRERGEDAPRAIAAHVRQAFCRYGWPGNVRELEHACERQAQTTTASALESGRLSVSAVCGGADGVFALLDDPGPAPMPFRTTVVDDSDCSCPWPVAPGASRAGRRSGASC